MSISSKIQSLITAANSVTGESRTDLTAAVQDLKDGYSGGGLPSGYTAVEWLESSGTQLIDTGILVDAYTRVVTEEAMIMPTATFTPSGMSEAKGDTSAYYNIGFQYGNDDAHASTLGILCKTKSTNMAASDWVITDLPNDGTKRTIDIQSGSQKVNGTQYGTQTIDNRIKAKLKLAIFGRFVSWGTPNKISERIWSYKVYSQGTLIRDFVPCVRDSDSEAGLYDLVNGVFYTNQGTGDFIVPSA